jgi:hypothetical protein
MLRKGKAKLKENSHLNYKLKHRERVKAQREGSKEMKCCSDGASAGAATSFTVQAHPFLAQSF